MRQKTVFPTTKIKDIVPMLCSISILFSCENASKDVPDDNWPPYAVDYPVFVSFVDANGIDLSSKIDMTEITTVSAGSGIYRTSYSIGKSDYTLECFVNDVEMVQGETINGWEVEKVMTGEKMSDNRCMFLCMNLVYAMDLGKYTSQEMCSFEYRFRVPAIFGDKENVIEIISTPQEIAYGEIKKAYFNGREIQENGREGLADVGWHFFRIVVE